MPALVRVGDLLELDLSPFHPRVGMEERSCGDVLSLVKGEERGRG
jgi:hypothetical protein